MAEIGYTDNLEAQDIEAAPQGSGIRKIVNVLGAAASLALIAGVCVWGYKLMVRDVSGVPVVRAIEGPMRIQPEEPGGRQADHQGLAVNAVAAEGAAEDPAERLVLAPRPVALSAEDRPMGELAATPVRAELLDSAEVDALVLQLIESAKPLDVHDESNDDVELVPAVMQVSAPDPDDEVQETAPVGEAAVVQGPGVSKSLRPQLRPSGATRKVSPAAPGRVSETDPETIAAGTRLAQLGAFDSPDAARGEWDKLNQRFDGYLTGKERVIQKATSGGRTFYRLRAKGFEDLSDARRFCSVLVAEDADCIPVTTR